MFEGSNAAAGALIIASPKVQVVSAIIDGFWRTVSWPSASCRVERVPSAANLAVAPRRHREAAHVAKSATGPRFTSAGVPAAPDSPGAKYAPVGIHALEGGDGRKYL